MKVLYIEGQCPKCGLGFCGQASVTAQTANDATAEIADIITCDVCGDEVAPMIGVMELRDLRCDGCEHWQKIRKDPERPGNWVGEALYHDGWGACWETTRNDDDGKTVAMTPPDHYCPAWTRRRDESP